MNTDTFEKIPQDEMALKERYLFAMERIRGIYGETTGDTAVSCHGNEITRYFHHVTGFLLNIFEIYQKKQTGVFNTYSLEDWKKLNQDLYQDVTGKNYETSFANPSYAKKTLGSEWFHPLSALYTELRGNIVHVFEDKIFFLAAGTELLIEIYCLMEQQETTDREVISAIHDYFSDYVEVITEDRLRDSFDPARDFATKIILASDLNDLSYLFHFGEYISENELETARYLNSLKETEIEDMAFTLTDGYRRGFELYQIDLSKKHSVNIRFHLGFERLVRAVIRQFGKLGLKPCIYRADVSIANRSLRGKTGYFGASPNKQYEYDHRMDDALFFDKSYMKKRLQALHTSYEHFKPLLSDVAGPAVIETFGEVPFNPADKPETLHYSEKQKKWKQHYQAKAGLLVNQYIPGDETSFSIISYPLPEIAKQSGFSYGDIFHQTIQVNTLDQEKYLAIQTKLIEALDQGETVTITGRGNNKTDLTVALTRMTDPETETIFENCLADVNIPLGEVFTSPKLKGTHGILHVTKVFLNDLEYHDLTLCFEDGIITDYTCKNFETEKENKRYILENVLFHHSTLPIGEFAIGTNTTAYMLGKNYHISHLLPILIAEKTGPHFAVGDTCFCHEEDLATYNPDGKRMIAKENDYSRLRHTDESKAYFNCHTDITIPYDELGDILVHTESGETIPLIKNGRFVLPGTESLNDVLV